ncbi:Altered polarity protein 6, partial [Intoshia linei]
MNDKIFSIEVELIKIFSALGVDKKENVESNFNFLLNSLLLDPVNESNLNKLSVDVKRNLAKRPGYSNAYYNFDNCLNILLKNESTQFLNSILVFFTNLETSNIDDESDSLTNSKMELNENTKSEKMFAGGPTQSTSGLGTMSILDTHTSNKTFPLITCNFSKCATKLEPTTISDFALMNECFYVLQGIQSCIIEFSENDKIHFINKDIKANYRQKQYVTKICSLGIIYIEIEHILNEILHHYPTQNSITKQVLVAAIRSELTIYFESLAILVSNVRKNKNKYNFTDLVVWFHKEMTIMNFLHLVCSVCKNKSGPVLMSILLSFNISADVKVAKTAKKFLSKLSQPWFNMITTWCLEGKLCDTYEFFIVKSPLKCFENLWTKAYFIKYQSLPKFISNHLAKKILLIGKSVNFIRVQCKVKSEISEYTKLKRFITQDSFSIYDDSYESKFVSMIDALYEETCSHLLHVMFTDFDLHLHFKIFHKFIVLQQGDFILEFMDLLSKELKTTKSLYLHNLTSILDVALRSITLSDSQINDRLDVKLLHSVENVSTWDAFCLTYHVDGPLETIFTNDVMLNYLRIFNFLWRLKRMKYMLTEIFQYQSTVRHSIFRKFNNLSKGI